MAGSTCCSEAIPSGAYAFADFANGCYWINGVEVPVASIAPDMAPGTDGFSFGWQATDAIRAGYGATSGWDFGGYFKLESTLASTLLSSLDYSIVLETVIDNPTFSIVEVYTYDAAVTQLWDFFLGAGFGGNNTLEVDDYTSLIAQKIGIPDVEITGNKKIGFAANQSTGLVSASVTSVTGSPISGTAIAGHRSPPQSAWANIAAGIAGTYGGPASTPTTYIKTMALYTSALSASALQTATNTATVECSGGEEETPPTTPQPAGGYPPLDGVWKLWWQDKTARRDGLNLTREVLESPEYKRLRRKLQMLEDSWEIASDKTKLEMRIKEIISQIENL